jgi:hypothetical protein
VGAAGIAVLGGVLIQATFEPYFTRYPVTSAGAWGIGTSAAMSLVRDTVPDGTTVCIDTATSSYWTFPQFVAWYLPGRGGSVVERVDGSARCAQPGAYLLARAETKVPAGVVQVARLGPPVSAVETVLWRVPPAP